MWKKNVKWLLTEYRRKRIIDGLKLKLAREMLKFKQTGSPQKILSVHNSGDVDNKIDLNFSITKQDCNRVSSANSNVDLSKNIENLNSREIFSEQNTRCEKQMNV